MPLLFQYLLKLSCSLAVVCLFYRLVLRRLTFYTANRWYLLGYSLLCFFIPFIDISTLIETHQLSHSTVVRVIPALETFTHTTTVTQAAAQSFTIWNYGLFILLIGMLVLLVRLLLQWFSYVRMRNSAQLIARDKINVYQVNGNVTPFSFGNAVFINQELHTESELQEIIRHEFVHVKQRHSIDIICMEMICILNWYNPFAWALRQAVRQNLEFIADDKVMQSGVSKKDYQYLLLKVLGTSQFSIAAPFNFSSLKKRIVMMNKMKSTKAHLVKFVFMLPLLAVMLVAFRNAAQNTKHEDLKKLALQKIAMQDTAPAPLPPVVTQSAPVAAAPEVPAVGLVRDTSFLPDDYNDFSKRNPTVRTIQWTEQNIIIQLKSGKKETYRRNDAKSMATIEKKYGTLPVAPPPPPPPPFEEPIAPQAPEIVDTTTPPQPLIAPPAPKPNRDEKLAELDYLRSKIGTLNDSIKSNRNNEDLVAMKEYLQQRQFALAQEQKQLQQFLLADKATSLTDKQKQLNQARAKLMQARQKALLDDQKASQDYYKKAQEIYLRQKQDELQQKQKALQDKKDGRSSFIPYIQNSNEIILTTDSVLFNATKCVFTFSGQTKIDSKDAKIHGSGNIPFNERSLLLVNGKEVTLDKSFANYKKNTYKLVMLEAESAVKKYGKKGANGAVEIQTL